MNESTRKRVRDQLDQLRLLINDEHPTKRLDAKDVTEISIIVGNLVYHQTGAGFNALGEDVVSQIIKFALKDQKYGKSCSIPQVCKKWKAIYDGYEKERLNIYLSITKPKWIWWIFLLHALEIGLLEYLTKTKSNETQSRLISFTNQKGIIVLKETLDSKHGTMSPSFSHIRRFWPDYKSIQEIMERFDGYLGFQWGVAIEHDENENYFNVLHKKIKECQYEHPERTRSVECIFSSITTDEISENHKTLLLKINKKRKFF